MDYFAALHSFVRSVELGSFSAAAHEQGAKVSTISRHVSALESDLGAALLNRSSRRLHPTEAGFALYARSRRVLEDLEEARAATRALNAHPQGLLRVTAPASFGRRHIMPHLGQFLDLYPDIRLDIGLDDTTVDLIETGIDLAIRIGVLRDSTLIARKLASHARRPVASPAWLAAQPPICQPEDLVQAECLTFSLQPGAFWYCRPANGSAAKYRPIAVAGRMRINDSEALLQAAIEGRGVALLPDWISKNAVKQGLLSPILPEWHWAMAIGPDPAIWGVYPPKKNVSPKVRVFIDFVASCLARDLSCS